MERGRRSKTVEEEGVLFLVIPDTPCSLLSLFWRKKLKKETSVLEWDPNRTDPHGWKH